MAASAAMAGLSACTKLPTEKIVPYVRSARGNYSRAARCSTPRPYRRRASPRACWSKATWAGPRRSRAIPSIPGSLGGTDVFTQASILNLYDPDRSQVVIYEGRVSTWERFCRSHGQCAHELGAEWRGPAHSDRDGHFADARRADSRSLLAQFPEAKWHQYEPCGGDSVARRRAPGVWQAVNTVYHFDQADVIVSLDADFLVNGPGHARYARDFASRRDLAAGPAFEAEPAVRGRKHADEHRRGGGPSPAAALERRRGLCAPIGGAAGVAVPPSANASVEDSGRLGRARWRAT